MLVPYRNTGALQRATALNDRAVSPARAIIFQDDFKISDDDLLRS
ncbi:MAG: hypothetical protein U1F40_06215 [Turneriella sp.]